MFRQLLERSVTAKSWVDAMDKAVALFMDVLSTPTNQLEKVSIERDTRYDWKLEHGVVVAKYIVEYTILELEKNV